MKEFTVDSINYLSCEFGIEFVIALYTNGGESNFNKPFLHFNVKKKYIYIYISKTHSQFDCKHWILDTGLAA